MGHLYHGYVSHSRVDQLEPVLLLLDARGLTLQGDWNRTDRSSVAANHALGNSCLRCIVQKNPADDRQLRSSGPAPPAENNGNI